MAFKIRSAGILKELDRQDEVKRLSQQRMDEREKLYMSLAGKYGPGTLAQQASGKGGATDSLAITIQALQDPKGFNLSDDLLAPVIASGDALGARKLLETLNGAKSKFEKDNRAFPESVVEEIVAGIITRQPTTKPLDMDKITKLIGREVDEIYLPFLQTMSTTPGEVYVPEYAYAEPVDINEIPKVMATVAKSQAVLAKSEVNILNKRLKVLQEIKNRTDTQQNELFSISDRISSVESAIKNLEENPAEIIGLYGNSYLTKLLESPGGEKYNTLPLPKPLTDAANQYPLVASDEIGKALVSAGVLAEGTIARLPTGELIELVRPQ
mgnify:FL=1|tara:strand:+ start:1498 stop:2475 length:978 start_codon:yes stop_codon:yes gene_type:complete